MKLYTKRQIFFASLLTAIFSLTVSALIFWSIYKITVKPADNAEFGIQTAEEAETGGQFPASEEDEDSFHFQTAEQNIVFNTADKQNQYTRDEVQNIFVYENCNEAVVNISTQVVAVNWFLEPVPQDGGSGSGSIIDKRGYVVTNVHVIENAYKIYISLSDGTQYEGRVVGQDSASDIAVLKFDPTRATE